MNYLTYLRKEITSINEDMLELRQKVAIIERTRSSGPLVINIREGTVVSDPTTVGLVWGELTDQQRALQSKIRKRFIRLCKHLALLLSDCTTDTKRKLTIATDAYLRQIEFSQGCLEDLPRSADERESRLRSMALELHQLTKFAEHLGDESTIIIPDTNALICTGEPTDYRCASAMDTYTFLYLPTVMGELDDMKMNHRNPRVVTKAKKAIKRIKGFLNQGDLEHGVAYHRCKKIQLKSEYGEPNMKQTLDWLDGGVPDDRILASCLTVMVENPNADVVLVTGDVNLQNKARAAGVPTHDLPAASTTN